LSGGYTDISTIADKIRV